MAKQIRTHLDFGKVAEIRNGVWHLLNAAPGTPADGQFYFDTALLTFRGYHGAAAGWLSFLTAATRLDQLAAPTAAVNFNGQRQTNVGAPTAGTDGVNRDYVDGVAQGLDSKPSAVWSTTANINLTGTAVQGGGEWTGALTAGDRILVKNQTAPAENGIYVAAAGAWTRALDFDNWGEVPGAYVFVERGVTNGDTGWVSTADAGGVLNTTAITWTQFSAAGTILGGAGLTKTGSTIDVIAAAGSGIVVNADNIDIDPVNGLPVNRGGTGAITAAGARAALGATGKYTQTIVGGAASEIITHNLNSRAVVVSVHDVGGTFDEVECDVLKTSVNTITLGFAVAPAAGAYVVTVVG